MKTAAQVNHDKQVAAIKPRVLAAVNEVRMVICRDTVNVAALESLLVFAKLSNSGLFQLVEEILRDAA
jgi:hypothetical protein